MSAIVKGPNPLLRIGHNAIVIGRKRSRPQKYIKEASEYNKGGYNHPEEEVGPTSERTLPHVPVLYK
jgi:hypothetical protein